MWFYYAEISFATAKIIAFGKCGSMLADYFTTSSSSFEGSFWLAFWINMATLAIVWIANKINAENELSRQMLRVMRRQEEAKIKKARREKKKPNILLKKLKRQ